MWCWCMRLGKRCWDLVDKRAFWLGLALAFAPWLLMAGLGQGAVIPYHDQLDGEMISYLLQAENWGGQSLPQFLGGVGKSALQPPAPLAVPLYMAIEVMGGGLWHLYMCLYAMGLALAYTGMWLLLGYGPESRLWRAVLALAYAMLPFLPVYGWSQYGLPLLVWAYLGLSREGNGRGKAALLLYCALFASMSSLVLVGFAVLGLWALALAAEALAGRGLRRLCWPLGGGILLTASYLWGHMGLLFSVLGREQGHKAHLLLTAQPWWQQFCQYLLYGGNHSQSYHIYALPAALASLLWLAGKGSKRERIRLWAGAGVCLALPALAAFWDGAWMVSWRQDWGALGAFQANRILWLAPLSWYGWYAYLLSCLLCQWRQSIAWRRICVWSLLAAFGLGLGLGMGDMASSGHLRANLSKWKNPASKHMSYAQYYAVDVMEEVAAYLEAYTGQPLSAYRVGSLGIDPAASLAAGFYALDGYSNNYPLAYKRAFRQIIAKEIEKSDYLRDYYDGWGNRVYLFSAQIPGYYTVEKGGFYYQDLELDMEAFSRLGGRFLLSAAYISKGEVLGLRLIREEAFETENSYYRIFVYEYNPRG